MKRGPLNDAPGDLRDEDVVAELVIRVRRSGAMSVAGCIHEEAYALAMLDSAKQSIKNHNARTKLNAGAALILPAHDNALAV